MCAAGMGVNFVHQTLLHSSVPQQVCSGFFRDASLPRHDVVVSRGTALELLEEGPDGALRSVEVQPVFGNVHALQAYPARLRPDLQHDEVRWHAYC